MSPQVWALAAGGANESLLATGAADATVAIWEDVTTADEEAAAEEAAAVVLKQQDLSNALQVQSAMKGEGLQRVQRVCWDVFVSGCLAFASIAHMCAETFPGVQSTAHWHATLDQANPCIGTMHGSAVAAGVSSWAVWVLSTAKTFEVFDGRSRLCERSGRITRRRRRWRSRCSSRGGCCRSWTQCSAAAAAAATEAPPSWSPWQPAGTSARLFVPLCLGCCPGVAPILELDGLTSQPHAEMHAVVTTTQLLLLRQLNVPTSWYRHV